MGSEAPSTTPKLLYIIIIIIITSIIIIIIEVLYSAVPQYYEVQSLVTEPVICEGAVDSCDDTLIGDSSSRSLATSGRCCV